MVNNATATPVRNDAELARLLGLDKSAVSRAKRKGMPTDSLEAAMAWRDNHLNVAMRKDTNPLRDNRPRGQVAAGLSAAAAIQRVHTLWPVAESALKAGMLHLVEVELRQAMRDVPKAARKRVQLTRDVMDALTAPFINAVFAGEEGARGQDEIEDGEELLSEEAMYCIAAKEPFPAEWLTH
jgi:hypothetical protein